MKFKCEMCFKETDVINSNHLQLSGDKYNINKSICDSCAKRISAQIGKNDRREITHTIRNIINENGENVFELKFYLDNKIIYQRYFKTYTESNNHLLPLIKLLNRYGKQALLSQINKMESDKK